MMKALGAGVLFLGVSLALPAAAALQGDVNALDPAAKKTLNALLKSVGIDSAKITSIERTPKRQARVMYDLARKDLDAALSMYCPAGDEVLKVYSASKSREENLKEMEQKLLQQLPKARELGCLNHIKNDEVYAVDIGLNQVPEQKRESFIQAGKQAVKDKKVERFLYPPRDPEAFHFEFRRAK